MIFYFSVTGNSKSLWKKYKKSWSIFKSSYKNLAKGVSFIDTPF